MPVSNHHEGVGLVLAQEGAHKVSLQFQGLKYNEAGQKCGLFYRRRLRLVAPATRLVRVGQHQLNLEPLVDQLIEGGAGELRRTAKNQSHAAAHILSKDPSLDDGARPDTVSALTILRPSQACESCA